MDGQSQRQLGGTEMQTSGRRSQTQALFIFYSAVSFLIVTPDICLRFDCRENNTKVNPCMNRKLCRPNKEVGSPAPPPPEHS